MKFLCLVYADEKLLPTIPDAHCVEYDEGLRLSGLCIASEALHPVATAATVRVREGRPSITDGPFAETKEQLAGFYLIDADTMADAIEVAAKIPPATVGSIEIRPVRPIRETVRADREAAATAAE